MQSRESDIFYEALDHPYTDDESLTEEEVMIWLNEPESVIERRRRFLQKMGFTDINLAYKASSIIAAGQARESVNTFSNVLVSSDQETEANFHCHGRVISCGCSSSSDVDKDDQRQSDKPLQEEPAKSHLSSGKFNEKKTKRWWRHFIPEKTGKKEKFGFEILNTDPVLRKMKVQETKKKCREYSAMLRIQEIQGHKGCIGILKFSIDGQFLASAGEDGIIRLWRVTTGCSTKSSFDEPDSIFKIVKSSLGRKHCNEVRFFMPEKILHIEERPIQEFHGHDGVICDLVWSSSNRLLSASQDGTVRLWQVGSDKCLKVFYHNSHVTCIQFNPNNEKYFISGSMDGKARIWSVSRGRVVSWADVRSPISAVCYWQQGKGFLVGSVMGSCRFYRRSGADFLLESKMQIQGSKRSSSGCRITNIQVCQDKPERVIIASEDSTFRIIDGVDIIHKYIGVGKCSNHRISSFTSSQKHIVSVGEQNSRVYIYNYDGSRSASRKYSKSVLQFESFQDIGVSAAAPWPCTDDALRQSAYNLEDSSLGSCFPFDGYRKFSVTWPEEKLPSWNHLDNFHGGAGATWGLAIVTASRDGKIRIFHKYSLPFPS